MCFGEDFFEVTNFSWSFIWKPKDRYSFNAMLSATGDVDNRFHSKVARWYRNSPKLFSCKSRLVKYDQERTHLESKICFCNLCFIFCRIESAGQWEGVLHLLKMMPGKLKMTSPESNQKGFHKFFNVGWQDDLGIFWKSYEIQAIDHSPNHAFNLWCFLGNTPDIHLIISAAVQQCLAVWDAPRGHVVNFFLRMHKRHGGFVSLLCLLMKMWILVRLYREEKTCPRDSMNYQHNTSALAGLSTRKVAKECLLFNSPWCWIFFVQLHTL